MTPSLGAAAFALGSVVGSFLNVCIYRLPRGESVVAPRSRCPWCAAPIRAYDNVPLVSWLLLGGRCRACRAPISARYPLIEALAGGLAVLAAARFGASLAAVAAFCFLAVLVVVLMTDLEFQIIPNEMTAAGLALGLLAVPVLPVTLRDSLIGAALGVGLLGGLAVGYRALTGRDGMGGGDVKLAAVLGSVLGWSGLLVTLFLASLVGTFAGVAILLATRRSLRTPLPFGVFLAPAAAAVLLIGPARILLRFGLGGPW